MGQSSPRLALVVDVVKGPLAIVRYESSPMDEIRCVASVGLERQKKH